MLPVYVFSEAGSFRIVVTILMNTKIRAAVTNNLQQVRITVKIEVLISQSHVRAIYKLKTNVVPAVKPKLELWPLLSPLCFGLSEKSSEQSMAFFTV